MSWIDDLFGIDNGNQNGNSGNNNNQNNDNNTNGNNGNNGSENALNDKDIALDMLIMSKADINSLAKAVTEITNPQLRQMLSAQLNYCINQHFMLSDMTIGKQWYNVFQNPEQQIQQDLNEFKNLS
jgi:similar to spore coat protein